MNTRFKRLYVICLVSAVVLTAVVWFGLRAYQSLKEQEALETTLEQMEEGQQKVSEGQKVAITGAASNRSDTKDSASDEREEDIWPGWTGTMEVAVTGARLYSSEEAFRAQEHISSMYGEYDFWKETYGLHPLVLVVDLELTNIDVVDDSLAETEATNTTVEAEPIYDANGNLIAADDPRNPANGGFWDSDTAQNEMQDQESSNEEAPATSLLIYLGGLQLAINGHLGLGANPCAIDPLCDEALDEPDHYWSYTDVPQGETRQVKVVFPLIASEEYDTIYNELKTKSDGDVMEFVQSAYGLMRYEMGDTLELCIGQRNIYGAGDSVSRYKTIAYAFAITPQIV